MRKPQHPNTYHWRIGADAVEKLCGKRLYICPLCLRDYREDQAQEQLTREHVPPKGLGGQRLVLTCKECNNKSGHDLDHHAVAEDQIRRFAADEPYNRNPVRLSYGGLDVNAELGRDGVFNTIRILSANPPGRIEKLRRASEEWGDGTDLTLTFKRRFNPLYAQISWLRSAYLLAFAWLGYRYILRNTLEEVRAQIRDPDTRKVGNFFSFEPAAKARCIAVIKEPAEARGIAVTAHGRIMLLPLFDQDKNLYSRVLDLGGQGLSVRGRSFGWPDQAIYRLDHATPEDLAAFGALRF